MVCVDIKKWLSKKKKSFNKYIKKLGNSKQKYNVKEVIVIMLFSLGMGFIMCFGCMSLFIGKNYFSVANDLSKVVDTYYAITDNYYGDIDRDSLIDGAINGMISSVGDVYTNYTNANDTEVFDETIKGSYEGIGCSVVSYNDGRIVVVEVFDNGPANKAGLSVGDVILKVDGNSYENKTSNDIANYIKNSGKDSVTITVMREDKELDLKINLSKVEIPSISGKIIEVDNKKIGYIDISLFADNSYKQFKNKLKELEDDGISGLIIDVRGNSGGYLSSVTDICNLFLEKGKVIYGLQDSSSDKLDLKKDTTKEKRSYGIVVIIDNSSASASEILASAIKESYNGFVVGVNSYGKGSVQKTKKLFDGSMIKYTTQKWFTPFGNSIDGVGVTPTNYVELNDNYYSNLSMDTDNQLQEAINLLKK